MKALYCCIMAIAIMSGCARQPWTKTDKVMFSAACAAQAYDFYTTKRALDAGSAMKSEWAWLYGSMHPSSGTLAASKAAQLGIAWVVLDRTPSHLRKVMLFIMTGGWVWYGAGNR